MISLLIYRIRKQENSIKVFDKSLNTVVKPDIIPLSKVSTKPIKRKYSPRSMTYTERIFYANKPNLQWWIDMYGKNVFNDHPTVNRFVPISKNN